MTREGAARCGTMAPMLHMVFIDVDGTLVGADNTVPAAVWEEAERCRAAGMRLALCTGRPAFGDTREYAARLGPAGLHVFQNGASIWSPGGETLSEPLPAGALEALLAQREDGDLLEWYTDTEYSMTHVGRRALEHAELLGTPLPSPGTPLTGLVRLQWVVSHARAAELERTTPPGLALHPAGSPRMPDTRFLSVTAAGVGKGEAILRVCAHLGIGPGEVMMVGDGENDVGAMRAVGHPVAMAGADAGALAASRWQVGSAEAGGLVQALRLARELQPVSA